MRASEETLPRRFPANRNLASSRRRPGSQETWVSPCLPKPRPAPGRRISLDPFDLFELQLDRGSATEDRHRNLDAAAIEIELLDHAIEAGERPFEHLDRIADIVIDLHLGLGGRDCRFLLGV